MRPLRHDEPAPDVFPGRPVTTIDGQLSLLAGDDDQNDAHDNDKQEATSDDDRKHADAGGV